MNRSIPIIAFGLALAAAAPLASAQPHAHDGAFVRFTPGIAGAAAVTHMDGNDLTLRGAAGRLGIALGWSVAPRLVIDAELLGHAVVGPELQYKGTTTQTDDNVTWGVSYAGLGASYFFHNNVNLNGSLGAMIMTLDAPSMDQARTDRGLGLKLGVGKEWWVSNKWGLGAALELLAGNVPDGNANWGVATVGLTMSATYN